MTENHEYCAIFFQKINEMLISLSREQDPQAEEMVFNPFHLKDDEHGGNKIGMVTVFGEDFVRNRTSSCEYHFNLSVKNHRKNVKQKDRKEYTQLCKELKEAQLKTVYQTKKIELETLILRQVPGDAKCLSKQLAFWHKANYM